MYVYICIYIYLLLLTIISGVFFGKIVLSTCNEVIAKVHAQRLKKHPLLVGTKQNS